MDNIIFHFLLVALFLFTTTLMLSCLLFLKEFSKRFFPLWVSSGLLSITIVLFQTLILKTLMGQSLIDKTVFIDLSPFMPFMDDIHSHI